MQNHMKITRTYPHFGRRQRRIQPKENQKFPDRPRCFSLLASLLLGKHIPTEWKTQTFSLCGLFELVGREFFPKFNSFPTNFEFPESVGGVC
jgi:hypothetical protein